MPKFLLWLAELLKEAFTHLIVFFGMNAMGMAPPTDAAPPAPIPAQAAACVHRSACTSEPARRSAPRRVARVEASAPPAPPAPADPTQAEVAEAMHRFSDAVDAAARAECSPKRERREARCEAEVRAQLVNAYKPSAHHCATIGGADAVFFPSKKRIRGGLLRRGEIRLCDPSLPEDG